MRYRLFAASLVIVSQNAFAQWTVSSPLTLGSPAQREEARNRADMNTSNLRDECLVRKSNGARECHTRAEWRAVAAQIDAAKPRTP